MIGRKLAHFKITAKLGEGGMGEVYRAEDSKLGREVAIKVLPEAFVADEERLARFEREAKVLASLEHPNIAGIYEVGEAEGEHFLVMQLAPGEDLAQILASGELDLETSLAVALQVAAALEAAHASGIVHRDLKPANIKVALNGSGGAVVKVLDFGLAKAWDEGGSDSNLSVSPTLTARMTQVGVILGTAGYMSPEQARGSTADARADVWSFGVVLYEMLTRKRLFSADTVSDTLARVLTFKPDDSDLGSVPLPLQRLLERCLEPDLTQRLQAIGEARIAIERYLADPVADTVSAASESLATTASPRSALRRWSAIAVTAIFAGLIATMVTWEMAPDPPEPAVRRFEVELEGARANLGFRAPISPDGRAILFPAERLTLRHLDQLEIRQLEGTEGAEYGIWSADSEHLAYQEGDGLYRIDVARGGKRLIGRVPGAGQLMDAVWLDDDSIVFATWRGGIYQVGASGGEPRELLKFEAPEIDAHSLVGLPGGRGVLAAVHADGSPWRLIGLRGDERFELGEEMDPVAFSLSGSLLYEDSEDTLWAVPFDADSMKIAGEPSLVVSGVVGAASLSSDGTLVYGNSFDEAEAEILRVDRSGTEIGRFGGAKIDMEGPELSPDGRYVVAEYAAAGSRVNNIFVFDLKRSVWTRLTSEDIDQGHPGWSADGRRIYFRDGSNVSTIRRDGVGGKTVLFPGRNPEAAPDGSRLAFTFESTLMSVALDEDGLPTGEAERVDGTPPGKVSSGVLSPNSNWVVYWSVLSARDEIYLTEFPESKSRWQISQNGGVLPRWSPDGNAIYYVDDNRLVEVHVDFEEEGPVLGSPTLLFSGSSYNGRLRMGDFVLPGNDEFLVVGNTGDLILDSPKVIIVENALSEIE